MNTAIHDLTNLVAHHKAVAFNKRREASDALIVAQTNEEVASGLKDLIDKLKRQEELAKQKEEKQ